jgi:hypothetical protein
MLPDNVLRAKEFVEQLAILPPLDFSLESTRAQAIELSAKIVDDKDQALVVGADIATFAKGVTAAQRQDVVNSTLLAQLAASKAVPDTDDITEWHKQYFRVLSNIGWAVQEQNFATYEASGREFEAHKAILDIAATLLAPNVAAVKLLETALGALRSLGNETPWIRLFNRESKHSNSARFQVTLAEESGDRQLLVSLMAFVLNAETDLTEILFFKFRTSDATLKHMSGRIAINEDVLSGVREQIKLKLANHAKDFVQSLPDL